MVQIIIGFFLILMVVCFTYVAIRMDRAPPEEAQTDTITATAVVEKFADSPASEVSASDISSTEPGGVFGEPLNKEAIPDSPYAKDTSTFLTKMNDDLLSLAGEVKKRPEAKGEIHELLNTIQDYVQQKRSNADGDEHDTEGGGALDVLSGGGALDALSGGGALDALSGGGALDALSGGGSLDALSGGGALDALSGGGGLGALGGGALDALGGGGGLGTAEKSDDTAEKDSLGGPVDIATLKKAFQSVGLRTQLPDKFPLKDQPNLPTQSPLLPETNKYHLPTQSPLLPDTQGGGLPQCRFFPSFAKAYKCPEAFPNHAGATFSARPSSGLTCNGKRLETDQAKAYPIVRDGGVHSVTVISPGSHYSVPPKVHIVGNGTGARVRAILDKKYNRIRSIKVLHPGSGYTSSPKVVIDEPDGEMHCHMCCGGGASPHDAVG